MGGLFSRTKMTVRGTYEMECVSASTAVRTICDAKSTPKFIPSVYKVELVRGTPGELGCCWIEQRLFSGRILEVRKTLTKLTQTDDVNPSFEVGQTLEVVNDVKLSVIPHFFSTYTQVIEAHDMSPGEPPSCTIHWSYAFLATNTYASVFSALSRKRLEKDFDVQVQEIIQCYYMEALRRTVKDGTEHR